jgi:Spx/MgsR family transcriptional regulator
MIIVSGLRSCDTCRKAIAWLKDHGIEHRFHDLRADGLDLATVARWARVVGWEALVNRRGTTWRGLPNVDKAELGEAKAIALMVAHPALIKRPVFEGAGGVMVGFDEAVREHLLCDQEDGSAPET